jgi:hypothetical protein
VGQELGAGAAVPPGVAAAVRLGVLPGVARPSGVVLGPPDPATDGEALASDATELDAVASGPGVGVREPPPAQPARARVPASRTRARRRRAGFMIEA